MSYDDFLRECIHRAAAPGEGAGVALSFRYAAEGEECLYTVRRAWHVAEGKLRESLHVSRDGQHDRWLSDNWHQLVEDLIPMGIVLGAGLSSELRRRAEGHRGGRRIFLE